MPKIDELKENLISLRFWLGVIVANFLAVIGWVVTNYKDAPDGLLLGASVYLCILFVVFVIINKKNYNLNKRDWKDEKMIGNVALGLALFSLLFIAYTALKGGNIYSLKDEK